MDGCEEISSEFFVASGYAPEILEPAEAPTPAELHSGLGKVRMYPLIIHLRPAAAAWRRSARAGLSSGGATAFAGVELPRADLSAAARAHGQVCGGHAEGRAACVSSRAQEAAVLQPALPISLKPNRPMVGEILVGVFRSPKAGVGVGTNRTRNERRSCPFSKRGAHQPTLAWFDATRIIRS